MVNSKRKGTKFEYDCKKWLKQRIPVAEIFRSPASLGSADLLCIYKGYGFPVVQMYQCKYLKKYMTRKERERIIDDAKRLCAEAFLLYREKPRGKIMSEALWINGGLP